MGVSVMKAQKLTGSAQGDLVLLAGAAVAVIALVWFVKRQAAAVAAAAGGLVTGNNAVTQGTPYAGTGVLATPAAIANDASGGVLAEFGGWLGRSIYDWTHPEEAQQLQSNKQAIGDNFYDRGYLQ